MTILRYKKIGSSRLKLRSSSSLSILKLAMAALGHDYVFSIDEIRNDFYQVLFNGIALQNLEMGNGDFDVYEFDSEVSIEHLAVEVFTNALDNKVEVALKLTNQNEQLLRSSIISTGPRMILASRIDNWQKDFGHDFVFSILPDSTDADLSQIGNNFAVVEFATTRSVTPYSLRTVAKNKLFKYFMAVGTRILKREQMFRVNAKARLSVIVSCRDFLVSSERFSHDLINELCLRKRVSELIFSKMQEKGFMIEAEDVYEDLTGLKNILSSILENDKI